MSPINPPRIGFIGFGEVASALAAALGQHGVAVLAHDVLLNQAGGLEILRTRERPGRGRFVPLAELIAESDFVLSTVTTSVASTAARNAAAHLRPGQTYLDLNATAPAIKCEMAGMVRATGADFVEGAILGAIGVTGAKTRILLGG